MLGLNILKLFHEKFQWTEKTEFGQPQTFVLFPYSNLSIFDYKRSNNLSIHLDSRWVLPSGSVYVRSRWASDICADSKFVISIKMSIQDEEIKRGILANISSSLDFSLEIRKHLRQSNSLYFREEKDPYFFRERQMAARWGGTHLWSQHVGAWYRGLWVQGQLELHSEPLLF